MKSNAIILDMKYYPLVQSVCSLDVLIECMFLEYNKCVHINFAVEFKKAALY